MVHIISSCCLDSYLTGTSEPYYSYPLPQALPLHESADGDYIDPSAVSPLYHNLTPEAASTEMGGRRSTRASTPPQWTTKAST